MSEIVLDLGFGLVLVDLSIKIYDDRKAAAQLRLDISLYVILIFSLITMRCKDEFENFKFVHRMQNFKSLRLRLDARGHNPFVRPTEA